MQRASFPEPRNTSVPLRGRKRMVTHRSELVFRQQPQSRHVGGSGPADSGLNADEPYSDRDTRIALLR